MMNRQEARRAWVQALRSGRYEQGKGRLNKDGKFCCLGVACELYIEDGGQLERVAEHPVLNDSATGYREPGTKPVDAALPPRPVTEWLGLNMASGTYGTDDVWNSTRSLAGDNDCGDTFEQIADTIESEPAGLFVPEVNES